MASGHTGNGPTRPEIAEEIAVFQRCAAIGAAVLHDPDLARIDAAWPLLPDAIRRAMLALIGLDARGQHPVTDR